MTSITKRGQRWLASILIVLLFGIILNDILLIGLGVLGLGYLILQYRLVRVSAAKVSEIKLAPNRLSLSIMAGGESSEVLAIESPGEFRLSMVLNGLSCVPKTIQRGSNTIELVYSPVLGEVKQVDTMELIALDMSGLFTYQVSLSVDYTFTAVPRVFPLAAQVFTALAEMGSGREGSTPNYLRGSGIEYAETREYASGDPLKRFDWKAYAKTTKPMVKEYYTEGGGGTSITYDNHADNPVSLDELNHAFLQLVLILCEQDTDTKLTLLRENESYELDRFNTLLLATQVALRGQVTEFIQYYRLLDPTPSRASFIEKALSKNIEPVSGVGDYSNHIIVSGFTGNPTRIYRLVETLDPRDIMVLAPTMPFFYQPNVEQSHNVYQSYLRVIERFERRGIRVYSSPEMLLTQLYVNH